MSDETNPDE